MNKKIGIVMMGLLLVCGLVLVPVLSKSIEQNDKNEKLITAQAQGEESGEFIKGKFSYRVIKNKNNGKKTEVELIGLVNNAKSIQIPAEVTSSNGNTYKVTAIGARTFAKNQTVETISIGSNIRTIKENAFVGCKNLKKITVKKGNKNYKVKENALYTKSGKTLVALLDTGVYYLPPKGVTNIKEGAFVYCKNLKQVILPETIKQIGGAFSGSCPNLEQVIFRGKKAPTMVAPNKKIVLNKKKTLEIVVPKGAKDTYKKNLNKIYDVSKLSIVEDKNSDKKKVYLTFDDGPSEKTGKILEVLKKYNAKATFFVLGKTDSFSTEMYKRIVEEGHTIGVHSTSHDYRKIYKSLDTLKKDYLTTRDIVWKATNIKPTLYRFPGGSSNGYCTGQKIQTYMKYFNDTGVVYVDWNASNEDATGRYYSAQGLADNAVRMTQRAGSTPVVLMHDAQAKQRTVDSLPSLLKRLNDLGYTCEALDEYVPPVQHRKVTK